MAWRRNSGKDRLRGDLRIVFRRFNCDTSLEGLAADPAPKHRKESPWMEEIWISLKRWEWRSGA
jgi:hypothetical protein